MLRRIDVEPKREKGVISRPWKVSILGKHASPTMPISLNQDHRERSGKKNVRDIRRSWFVCGKKIRNNSENKEFKVRYNFEFIALSKYFGTNIVKIYNTY